MEKTKLLKKKRQALDDGNLQQFATASKNLGAYYNEKGFYENALSEFKDEANTYQQLGNKMEKIKSHRMIGEMYMEMGEFSKAFLELMIYLNGAREENDKIEEQRALATIGRCHLLHGQSLNNNLQTSLKHLEKAEKSFLKSLSVCKDLTGKISRIELLDMQARLYLNLGVTKDQMDNFDESFNFMENAIKICQANDFFELLHQCYITVGLSHQKQNDSIKSIRFFNLGLKVGERLPNKTVKMCETLMFKAEVLIKTGDFQSAKQILQRAYKMKTTEESDSKNIEKLLKVVAALCYTEDSLMITDSTNFQIKKELYEKMGDGSCKLQSYSMAINYYLKMLEYAKMNNEDGKTLIPIYISLYETYKDNKQFDLALNYLWKEYELCKDVPKEACSTLLNIGEVYENSKKTFWDIQEIYQRARKEAQIIKDIKLEGIVLNKMIALQKSNDMSTMAEILEDEAKNLGIDLTNTVIDSEDQESDTPDIGTDICLDDLSDSSSDPEISDQHHDLRKRLNTSLTVKKNSKGETQLHQACISGNLTLVRRLIDQGHPLKIRDNAGWLPLHEACIHGHKDIVELILERGGISLINDKGGENCDGITPIYDACSNGHLDIVELLLDRGAKATVRTDFDDNCLSALEKWKETVQLEFFEVVFYDTIRSRITEKFKLIGSSTNKRPANDEQMEIQQTQIDDDSNSTSDSIKSSGNLTNVDKCAKFEYQSVMENLRTRHEQHPSPIVGKKTKRSAILEKAEVGEDWLDNDVIHTKKKQKMFTNQSPVKLRQEQPSTSTLVLDISDEILNADDELSVDAFDILMNPENNPNVRKTKRLSLSHKNTNESVRKQQSSLLKAGFSRFRSESPSVETTQPDSTSFLEKSQKTNTIKSFNSVKVKVEDLLLLVPFSMDILNTLTIEWLGKETSRRYYNLEGICPELQLKTSDGAIFEGNDSISLALAESFVSSTVLKWILPPITQRYSEACSLQKTEIDQNINSLLDICQATQKLSLNDQQLSYNMLQPVFKTLQHQNSLMELDLSQNFIQDEDIMNLVKSLRTLEKLKILNLSGNMITADGIENLSLIWAKDSNILLEITDLDLSFNPLRNESIRFLAKFCNNLKNLKKLKISSCEITNLIDENLNLSSLHQLDLSYNSLNIESIRKILNKLNSSQITSLNLSFCATEPGIAEHIVAFLNSGTCKQLNELSLMSCKLNDADIWEIIKSIPKSLETLKLTENSELTSNSLKILLNSKKLKYINLLGCDKLLMDLIEVENETEVGEYKFPERIMLTLANTDKLQQIEKLKRIWEKCWDERWRIKSCDMNVVLFVDGDSKTNSFKGFLVN